MRQALQTGVNAVCTCGLTLRMCTLFVCVLCGCSLRPLECCCQHRMPTCVRTVHASPPHDSGARAFDALGTDLSDRISVLSRTLDTSRPTLPGAPHAITYTVFDEDGAMLMTATRHVIVACPAGKATRVVRCLNYARHVLVACAAGVSMQAVMW